MARLAGCRQNPRVWGARGALVISLVTAITIGIGSERAVVKDRSRERGRGVAIATGVREIHRDVIRRFLIIRRMAGIAVHRCPAKVFSIRSGMALDAENCRVYTR